MTKKNLLAVLSVFVLGFSVSACSTTSESQMMASDGTPIYDPFEDTNRAIFAFNTAVDNALIHPAIKGYRYVTPKPARTGLRNFLRHLKSPVTLANQMLQGDVEGSKNVLLRATINTFVGVGVFDFAGYEGIEYEPEDFGQTLAVWGVDHGPYLVLPFLGASSARDYGGFAVDALADPLGHYVYNIEKESLNYYRAGLTYLDLRDSLHDLLEDLEDNSIDYYASVRSIYYQRRSALVADIADASAATSDFDDIY